MLNTLNALFSATTVLFHLFKYEYFAQCRLLALITLELNFNSEHNEHFFHLRLVKLIWSLKTLFFSSCIPIKTLGKKNEILFKGKAFTKLLSIMSRIYIRVMLSGVHQYTQKQLCDFESPITNLYD